MSASGDSAQLLTDEAGSHILPSWTRDGSAVYFTSNRSGRWEIWRRDLIGHAAGQITHDGGFNGFESVDAKWVYYAKPGKRGLWRAPTGGGAEEQILTDIHPNLWGNWALAPQGIYYMREEPRGWTIALYDLATRTSQAVHTMTAISAGGDSGLAVSANGHTLLYCQVDRETGNIVIADLPRD